MRSVSPASAVSRITGTLPVARSSRHKERPSSPGIMTSSTTRSIASAWSRRRATAAFSAALTRKPLFAR